jgi:hypothetical protein
MDEDNAMTAPPDGASADRATLHDDVPAPVIEVGLQVSVESVTNGVVTGTLIAPPAVVVGIAKPV